MKNLLLLFLLCFLWQSPLSAQQSMNMNFLGNWHDGTLPVSRVRYNDIWGYTRDGREYAIMGSRNFVHILDVTDPSNITEIGRYNEETNGGSIWRDIKVLGDYAYCVADQNTEGLQVIDLSNLPTSASIVFQDDTDFHQSHNIFIDDEVSPAKLYVFGSLLGNQRFDLLVYSLVDPAQPQLLATVDLPGPNYIHDGYALRDTLYANQGNSGMYVYDLRDLTDPLQIGSLTNYPRAGYNHSCWPTDNGKTLIMCDEVPTGLPVRVVDVDKSNPFILELTVVDTFRSNISNPSSSLSVPHNPYVLGDSLVVMSYYDDGIQVWNIKEPTNPRRLGYYDTSPNTTTYGNGVWGAFPLPSGKIIGSDLLNGLFVVEVANPQLALPVEYSSWEATEDGKNALLSWSTATETDNAGWIIEHAAAGGVFAEVAFVSPSSAEQRGGTTGGDYSFTHATPGPGLHYYRLRQRDFDGTEQLSEVRTVLFATDGFTAIAPSPNPAPAAAPIWLRGLSATDIWMLHDSQGRLIRQGKGNKVADGLLPGVYFVQAAGKEVAKVVVR